MSPLFTLCWAQPLSGFLQGPLGEDLGPARLGVGVKALARHLCSSGPDGLGCQRLQVARCHLAAACLRGLLLGGLM